ncbi:MAG: DUF1304 domain-containing protein [Saprospiraceae bacterium]
MLTILILCIAGLHLYFLWFEMFSWERHGRKIFGGRYGAEFFTQTKSMAANQGIYNGFLAAGLIWSRLITDAYWRDHVALFFLGCIVVAGIVGAMTADRKIFFVQSVPALAAIGWWWIG